MQSFLKAKEIVPGVYAISGEAVLRYLVIGGHHALLFDTGYGFADISQFVKTLTDLPLYVVNSHGHVDHAGGNCFFDGPVYLHPADLEVYKCHQSGEFRDIMWHELRKMQRMFFLFTGYIIPKQYAKETYLARPLCDNFLPVKEGDVFDLGGVNLEVVEIPGHTAGSIGLYCKEKRLFFSGDGMNGGTWLFLPESCRLAVYLDSLRKVEGLEFDYLLSGHNSALEPKSVLEDYMDVAENLDFTKGKILRPSSFAPGAEVRLCRSAKQERKGKRATLQISADKL